jgi:hypothetical protein
LPRRADRPAHDPLHLVGRVALRLRVDAEILRDLAGCGIEGTAVGERRVELLDDGFARGGWVDSRRSLLSSVEEASACGRL